MTSKTEMLSEDEMAKCENASIGFVGLGIMGSRMAANLQKSRYKLVVNDLRKDSAASLIAEGAIWADTPQAVAEQTSVFFTSLPEPADVERVALGSSGLLAGAKPGTAFFDLSTNSPVTVKKIAAAFEQKGSRMFDAPVSGGPRGAETGKLAIWVSGDESVYNECKPVLDAIGDQARYIGPIGMATIAKLVHNMSSYALVCVLAETFSLGVKAGMDPLELWQAVRQGASGRQLTFDGLLNQFLPGQYDPPSFALRLAHKDVALANALGRDLGLPMRMCNLAYAEMTEALNRGWADRDSRSVMLLQQERAGIKIAVDADRLRVATAPAETPAHGSPP